MKKFLPIVFLLLNITGCVGNLASVHHDLEVSHGKGVLIDIKQRGIISSVVPIYDRDGRIIRTETRVCAESSPDAMSAYAAELAAKADTGKIGAQLATAFQEGAAYVGMRTPTIQSLRDASYRLCESYLNNAISGAEYGWQLRRFQRNMVVLAAVEQLTGTIARLPGITIKMQGQAEVAKSLPEIAAEKKKVDEEIAKLESGTPEEKEKNKEKLEELKQKSKTLNNSAKGLIASGLATTEAENPSVPQASDQNIATVSDNITKMVNKILDQDDKGQLCFIYLDSLARGVDTIERNFASELKDICIEFLSDKDRPVRHAR